MLKDLMAGFRSGFAREEIATKETNPLTSFTGPQAITLTGGSLDQGGRELIDAYHRSPNLRKVVGILSHCLASTPWYLKKKAPKAKKRSWSMAIRACQDQAYRRKATSKESIEIYEHPFLDFLQRGSPLLSGPESLQVAYAYRLIKGEWFWQLMGKGDGALVKEPHWYMVIPPQNVVDLPKVNRDSYEIRFGGKSTFIPSAEMVWAKDANLSSPLGRGRGIGDALSDELDTDEYAANLLRITLANKGFSDVIIGIKQSNERTAELVEAKYNQRHRGFYNAGRALVVDTDKLDVKPVTHALSELRLLELREFERDVIGQTFGVPPELLGRTENSNRATITGAETLFAKYSMKPRLEAMRLTLQTKVLPLFDPHGQYVLEFESPVPSDLDYELEVMKAAPFAFTLNEYRVRAGEPEMEWGNERALPTAPAEPDKNDKENKQVAEVVPPKQASKASGVTISQAEMEALLKLIDSSELYHKISPEWRGRMQDVVDEQWSALGFQGSFNLVNPLISDHLEEFGGRWITMVDDTTKELVGKALAEGVAEGEGIAELARRVKQQMGYLADGYRSRLIARTEVVRSSNLARKMSWDTTGMDLHKRYISALVKNTRDSHANLHDSSIPSNEKWTYNAALEPFVGDTIDMPGNSAHAAHSCHCLCTAVAFDPEHASASASIPYGSDAHVSISKAFDRETASWERYLLDEMAEFYPEIEKKLLDKLSKL